MLQYFEARYFIPSSNTFQFRAGNSPSARLQLGERNIARRTAVLKCGTSAVRAQVPEWRLGEKALRFAMKAQQSDKPLLLDSTFDPQMVRTLAPMSWMIENDVQRGRSHMNLSHWKGYNPEEQQEILSKMSVLVRNRDASSPLSSAASRGKAVRRRGRVPISVGTK